MTEKNKEFLVQFIESVWNNGDIHAVDTYLADTYTVHHDPGDPWDKQTLSVDGFKERVKVSRAPFPDQRFSIHRLIAEGDQVVMSWLWKGTHQEAIPGFEASGKQIEMSGVTLYFFEGGRISGHWQVADRFGVYQQLLGDEPQAGA